MSESLEAFRWFDKAGNWESLFSSWERTLVIYTGAFVMWMVARKLKKRHQLKPGKQFFAKVGKLFFAKVAFSSPSPHVWRMTRVLLDLGNALDYSIRIAIHFGGLDCD